MNWKNIIENLILIIVMFIGLGVYTSMVLKPIIVESIRQENTKIENNIETTIDNKFKKIDALTAQLPLSIPVSNTQQSTKVIGKDSICLPIKNLTRRQKKRLGLD
tara:strand:+ start:22964 stop:23278 length:315 start_codon:yes stop_codon:yes gene_type:complete